MRTPVSVLLSLFCVLIAAPAVRAQTTHAAPPSAIDEALQQHAAGTDADRALVLELLARPDVRALAGDVGLDIRRAQSAVATLEGEQLAQLAAQARLAEQALAGGQSGSVTLSYTLIIIGLLVLILLILVL